MDIIWLDDEIEITAGAVRRDFRRKYGEQVNFIELEDRMDLHPLLLERKDDESLIGIILDWGFQNEPAEPGLSFCTSCDSLKAIKLGATTYGPRIANVIPTVIVTQLNVNTIRTRLTASDIDPSRVPIYSKNSANVFEDLDRHFAPWLFKMS